MKKKIFVALSTFGEFGQEPITMLKEGSFEYRINSSGKRLVQKEIIEMARDCEGIIAGVEPYDDGVLDNLPKLRCISRCGVGIDNISLNKARERGIEIFNTPDAVVQPVAELTVGMIFDLLRNISYQSEMIKKRKWEKKAGSLLAGKNVGVLGLGRIGKRTAEMLVALGAKVYGTDIRPDRKWAVQHGVEIVSLDRLLKISDILCIHLSVLEDHPFKLGVKEIGQMKPGAFIVNVSRGQLVDEDALYAALKNGRLGGAGLDVFMQEPYTEKLAELSNVVLTPHIATLTRESRLQMEIEATKNLLAYLEKKS